MKTVRMIFLHIGVWLAVLALLFGLLVAAAAVPNEAIRHNMEQSALSYADKDPFSFENGEKLSGVADHYADTILLGVAWNMGKGSPLAGALDTGYYDGGELGENYGLYLAVTENAEPNTEYTRYWHGTAALVRFLHLFTDVDGMKALGLVFVLLLAAAVAAVIAIRGHYALSAILLVSLCAVRIWDVRLSMEYQPAVILALLLCLLYLFLEKRGSTSLTLLSAAGGAAVCFFDFLTAETLTLLLPLTLVVAVRAREKRLGTFAEGFRLIALCGASWISAYAAAFAAKWTLASVVTGENAFKAALLGVGERIGGEAVGADVMPRSIFSAVVANLGTALGAQSRLDYVAGLLIPALLLTLLFSLWYLFRRADGERTAAVLLLLLGAAVLLRFLAINNHSYLHCFFTYRALIPLIFACLASVYLNVGFVKRKRGKR